MAANRSDMVHASNETMNDPSESPLAYTREVSMQSVDSNCSSMAVTNWRSVLELPCVVLSHRTGEPVPLGKATTNPWRCPRAPNWVVAEWMEAPSARPWKSTTRGRGVVEGAPVGVALAGFVGLGAPGAGVVSRNHRATPPTSMSWRAFATAAGWAMAHPDEGTGAPVATACVAPAPSFVPGEFAVAELEQPEHPKARARARTRTRAETGPANLFVTAFVMRCSEPHQPEIRPVDIRIWAFIPLRHGRTPDSSPSAGEDRHGRAGRTGSVRPRRRTWPFPIRTDVRRVPHLSRTFGLRLGRSSSVRIDA